MVPAFAQTTTSTTTTTTTSTTSTSSTSTLPNGVTALYGADEFGTANAIANAEYPKGTSTAILASGLEANWVDSLTAAPLAKALKAPILLTSGVNTVGTETMAELTKLGVTKVILIGAVGSSVNAPKIEAELGSGITATTISGSTRFGTAGLVAQALAKIEGVTTFKTVFVASGEQGNLVDALAADPVAAEMGDPILLVPNTGDSSPID
ncbi:MAG: cell wall-binding repeat-containing protein, partial [Firmicutes bacterium]|nr:cell wall-binding repeat-containing protein [Bacillota bacterium]